MLSILLAAVALAVPLYSYTTADGTVVLTQEPPMDGRRVAAGVERWWAETEPGAWLPNGVPMPRLDRIANLDAYDAHILDAAAANGIPAELIKAVAVAESRMTPTAVSSAGAKGLMQLIPSTAKYLGVTDVFDPVQSIRGGASYLGQMVGKFGTYQLAVAAYNAGPTAVSRFGGIPPYEETRTYVVRVIGLYEHFRDNRPVSR